MTTFIKEDYLLFCTNVYKHFYENPNSNSYIDEDLKLMAVPEDGTMKLVNVYEEGKLLLTLENACPERFFIDLKTARLLTEHELYIKDLQFKEPILTQEFFDEGMERLNNIGLKVSGDKHLDHDQIDHIKSELHLIIEIMARATQAI